MGRRGTVMGRRGQCWEIMLIHYLSQVALEICSHGVMVLMPASLESKLDNASAFML